MDFTAIAKVNIPYPMVYNFSVEAKSIDTVPNKVMKLLRKRLREDNRKRKHIENVNIDITHYKTKK